MKQFYQIKIEGDHTHKEKLQNFSSQVIYLSYESATKAIKEIPPMPGLKFSIIQLVAFEE